MLYFYLQIFATSKLMLGPALSISRDGTITASLGTVKNLHMEAVWVTITTLRVECSV